MYQLKLNEAHKRVITEAIDFVILSLKGKDVEIFEKVSENYNKTLSSNDKKMVDVIKDFIPKLSQDNIKSLEDLKYKINNKKLLTRDECSQVERSLDGYSRLGMGQVGMFYDTVKHFGKVPWDKSSV